MENQIKIDCFLNTKEISPDPGLFEFVTPKVMQSVIEFHKTIPHYKPTPLVELKSLARFLGTKTIWVKDESRRFDLNAFKVLGASYAMAKAVCRELGEKEDILNFTRFLTASDRVGDLTFVTATDGNHGRAVAWTAKKFGSKAVAYMPKGTSSARLQAIHALGANAGIIDGNYDDAVALAQKTALENNWVLVQDTAFEGYEHIPEYIMQGYSTLISEVMSQTDDTLPTHVFAQAGVGSFAAAVMASLYHHSAKKPRPKFVVVEPRNAACVLKSAAAKQGCPLTVEGELKTIMAGLACGTPSMSAWAILKAGTDAFISCSDEVARRGMRVLGNPMGKDQRIISGESGAVCLGLVHELMSNPEYQDIKDQLSLDKNARILVFSTEGDTDPEHYREVVWNLK
ncbi:MAG: diaminopropionate ammonia-lyase [Desulfobacteraceae bacterium]|nr:diaminopropionate ammonia-lyase [Desulfobacteraceae bacterium]